MEQQTPILPKSRLKASEGQKRAIFPSLIWGEGGSRFSIYFVQDFRFVAYPYKISLSCTGRNPGTSYFIQDC